MMTPAALRQRWFHESIAGVLTRNLVWAALGVMLAAYGCGSSSRPIEPALTPAIIATETARPTSTRSLTPTATSTPTPACPAFPTPPAELAVYIDNVNVSPGPGQEIEVKIAN